MKLKLLKKYFTYDEYAHRYAAWLIRLGDVKFCKKISKDMYPHIRKYI